MQWNVPEHADALGRLHEALADPRCAGAVIVGPDGAGKSTLVRLAADRYAADHPEAVIRRVTGTPTERAVPFGAFRHLVHIADAGKPAALLRAARLSLRAQPADLLIVDEAGQLDPLSATLVYQLALAGQTRMVVTARGEDASQPIRALWDDTLMPRIDIDAPAASGIDVDAFLAALPAPAREVVEFLAVQEPIPRADLVGVTSADAVADAQRLGAVEVLTRGDDELVFTAHPLFAERALAALGADGGRRVRTLLVPAARARLRDHPSDRLRLALLTIDSDAPQPAEETLAAAGEALRLGDVVLAERLSRVALAGAESLDARLLLGQALAWQGRGREADDVLAAVAAPTLTEPELMTWALPRAANQFWMLGEPEQATAFLRNTRERLREPAARVTVDALSATFAMNAGGPQRALQIAEEVLASQVADDIAVAWAASAASLCSARIGRFGDVEPFAQRAFGAEHPGLLRFTAGLAQTTALLMAGELDTAEQVAREYTDFAELQQPGRAIGEVLLAHVQLEQGDFEGAAALLGPASATLDRTGYSWGPLSLTLLATALARLNLLSDASKVLARAETRHGTKSALFAPELGLAKAWRAAAARDEHAAVTAARGAAGMAERSGQAAVAVRCWRAAVQLGDAHALGPLTRVAAQADCTMTRAAVAEAQNAAQRLR